MSAPRPPRERSLGFLLADAVRSARRDFAQRAQGLQLTPALARLLYSIDRNPGCRQADLAVQLEITPVTLGRMVDRLVDHGYARRVADAGDRRAVRVYLDAAGEPLIQRVDDIRRLTEARAMSGLSDDERETLLRLLSRICANLAESES